MRSIDHVLKLYVEILHSPYLHYGFWENGEQYEYEEFSLDEIVAAQERYIAHVADQIPADVSTILDVGCGIGGNSAYLQGQGFQVEALSPDVYQEVEFKRRLGETVPFHLSTFEAFEGKSCYDLILMSESASYIKVNAAAEKAFSFLERGGYWLISDYFVWHDFPSQSLHLRSTHRLQRYLDAARQAGFELVHQQDITANILPSLDIALHAYERLIAPPLGFLLATARTRYPRLMALIERVLGNRVRKQFSQIDLLRRDSFVAHRKYLILLFRRI